MSVRDDGGPAFPSAALDERKMEGAWLGMTLRDYFAAHAPALPHKLGVLAEDAADIDNPDKTHGEKCEVLLSIAAEWRYRYADAMLAAREGGAK